jgi:ubiquinone/menaquinone biosynthesis C-methylase UbiE
MERMDGDEVVAFWNRVASDWDTQVGGDGDENRLLNSDPVLWRFAGDVKGLDVIDAGCGTGYLSRKFAERGASVVGIDVSPKMIEIARKRVPGIEFSVDSCSELGTVANSSVDLVVANYVLMDTPDLEGTMRSFYRVLRPGGHAVLVFSHPCFPQGLAHAAPVPGSTQYVWDFSYFEATKRVDPPWGHFESEFIWFHRPLSQYFKAFKRAGFDVAEFEEPRISEDRYGLVADGKRLEKLRTRPYSVAFKLRKTHSVEG